MSLILDALRKMELERKATRQNSAEIRTDVLNYHSNPQLQEKSRLLPIIVALLLFSSATALYFYFNASVSPKTATLTTVAPIAADSPARADAIQPAPLLQTQPVRPTEMSRAAETVRPPVKATENRQPAGDDTNIAVSGIAWQEERSLRRAVINGALVSEGADISGAKVVEIRENLVRFSRGERIFEITYTSGSGR